MTFQTTQRCVISVLIILAVCVLLTYVVQGQREVFSVSSEVDKIGTTFKADKLYTQYKRPHLTWTETTKPCYPSEGVHITLEGSKKQNACDSITFGNDSRFHNKSYITNDPDFSKLKLKKQTSDQRVAFPKLLDEGDTLYYSMHAHQQAQTNMAEMMDDKHKTYNADSPPTSQYTQTSPQSLETKTFATLLEY